ncbi:phage tail tip lysozyme [bacterium]|nr:phage tail tip lysozyme [bacterium]
MTEQFDEGYKEILLSLLSLGATAYETDYILKHLDKRSEPVEQKIEAIKQADDMIQSSKFDQVAAEVMQQLVSEPEPEPEPEPTIEKTFERGSPEYIADRLIKGGITPTAAVGIVANLKAESNLNPAIKQYGGGPGRGLAQWERGGRFDTDRINLVKFAKSRGTDWTDLDTQIDFILHEMRVHPEYKRVKEQLNNVDSIKDATLLFLRKYEKAGTPHTAKRVKYAEELSDLI